MRSSSRKVNRTILERYERVFGSRCITTDQPDGALPVHLEIHTFPPIEGRPCHVIATSGVSAMRQPVPEGCGMPPRVEIMMLAQKPESWIYNLLLFAAKLPLVREEGIAYGHQIRYTFPIESDPSSRIARYFMHPLGMDGLSPLLVEGEPVDILLLASLNTPEKGFAVKYGEQALCELFRQRNAIPLIDGEYPSLVPFAENSHAKD